MRSKLPNEEAAVEYFGLLLVFVLFIAGCLPILLERTGENLYTQQAAAWLQGRLDVPNRDTDVAFHAGKLYVPFPPFPALLLVPIVYLLGEVRVNVPLISVFLTGINLLVIRSILMKLGQASVNRVWLAAAFLCGTGYWTESIISFGVWGFAHIVAVTALLMALNEVMGGRRGWLAGLLLGAAFLSRQLTIFGAPFLSVVLWIRGERSDNRRFTNQAGFWLALGLFVGVYLIYNYARFGDPFETGYGLIALTGGLKDRFEKYGLFSPVYIPFNLVWFFLQGFQVVFVGESLLEIGGLSPYGTSITYASPFLFLAFLADWKRPMLILAWISTGLILGTFLCYYNNGWVQVNTQRFSLDFIPLLLPLVALGYQRVPALVWQSLIAYSVGANVLAILIQFWLPYLG